MGDVGDGGGEVRKESAGTVGTVHNMQKPSACVRTGDKAGRNDKCNCCRRSRVGR